jgi:hypothetical protein
MAATDELAPGFSAPELRPLAVGEVLDRAIKIYWRNAWTLVRIVLFVVVPVEIVNNVIRVSTLQDELVLRDGLLVERRNVWVGASLVATLLTVLSYLVATGACYRVVADAYLGRTASFGEAMRFTLRRLHSILWLAITIWLGVALMLVCLIIPGIYVAVLWSVAIPALLNEGLRGRAARKRSRELVSGRWWPTFGTIVVGYLLQGVIAFAAAGVAAVVLRGHPIDSVVGFTVATIANIVGSGLATPFLAALIAVIYFDLRVRKEGYDIELQARRVGVEPEPGEAPAFAPPPAPVEPPYWPPPPGWKPPEPGPL